MNNEKMLQTRVRFPEHAVFSSNIMAQLVSWDSSLFASLKFCQSPSILFLIFRHWYLSRYAFTIYGIPVVLKLCSRLS